MAARKTAIPQSRGYTQGCRLIERMTNCGLE